MVRLLAAGLLVLIAVRIVPGQSLPSGLALAAGVQAHALRETERRPDPFPIRRVLLAPGAPLPVAPEGDPFRRMPREEFERLVRDAARNAPVLPKLARADYRATLTDESLTGTGEWQFASAADGAFPLDPLKLAWHSARWSGGRAALVFGTPAKLWVETAGRSPLAFAWSGRGTGEPGAVRFQLGVPAAPLAVLELDLPTDRIPTAKAGTLLVGPLAKPNNRALWRIAFGGESNLEFSILDPAAGRPAPVATVARTTKFDLAPGLATAAIELEVAALRDPLSTLDLAIDPGLTIVDVTAPGLASWRATEGLLRIGFREPQTAVKVAVVAVAALPADGKPWPVPNLHAAPVPASVDLLEVVLGPDLKWDGCTPGDYRAIRTTTTDRGQTLTFRGSLPAPGRIARAAPTLLLRGAAAEFTTVETHDWQIEVDRSQLTARLRATVVRGPLARLIVRVPPNAKPFATVLAPDDPTATFTALGNNLWAVEPTQPIATGESLDVRMELRGPIPAFDAPGAFANLDLVGPSPVGAVRRDGTTQLRWAAGLRGWIASGTAEGHEPGATSVRWTRDTDLRIAIRSQRTGEPERLDPPAPKAPGRDWRFAALEAVARVEPDGSLGVVFSGTVREAADRVLPVALPPGATVDWIRSDGKWADGTSVRGTVSLPIPQPDADGVAFELAFHLPAPGTTALRVGAFTPGLPGSPTIRTTLATGPHYRAWPTLEESAAEPALLLPTGPLRAAGWGCAVLLLGGVVGPWVRGSHPRIFRGILVVLAGGLGTATWLAAPGWSLLLAPSLAVALAGLLLRFVRPGRAAALFAIVLLPVGAGIAQAPVPATVYLVHDSADESSRLVALVPRSVQDRLAALATPPLPAVALADAEYVGTETDGVVRFEATWRVDVRRGGSHEFDLPLAGVKLEAMTLDGAPAFPDASRPGRYRLAVAGPGSHALAASFAVPSVAVAGDLEVRFAIPELPATRVALALPVAGRSPDLIGRLGGQWIVRAGDRATLRADLGAVGQLAIRWRSAVAAAPVVTVVDATIWDVNETRAEAVAGFLHRVERGTLSRLVFELPAGLEPGQFAVRELDAGAGNGLKDWILEPIPAGQRLTLVLRQPARGALATTFRLVSRTAPSAQPALAMPRTTTGDVTASYLGVRLAGVAAEGWQNQNLIDVPADSVAREFALVPEIDFDRLLARSLRREGPNPPIAKPTLRALAPAPTAVHDLAWTLGPRADVVGTVQWTGVAGPSVECDVPTGVELVDVAANELATWERIGPRLRLWFKADARDPSVRWIGTWSAYDPATVLELPAVPGATVRVRPVDGTALAVTNAPAIKFLPPGKPREWAYRVDSAAVPKFRIDRPAILALAQTESLFPTGGHFEHRVELAAPLAANRGYALSLVLANLPPGSEPRIEWPVGTVGVESASTANRRTWLVDVAAPFAKLVVVTRFPARAAPELPTVELLASGVPLAKSKQVIELPDDLRPAPGLARRDGKRWTIVAEGPIALVDVPTATAGANDSEPAIEAEPESKDAIPRAWYAAPWLAGFALVVGLAWRNPSKWSPEILFGFGCLAIAVVGWAFAPVAACGAIHRIVRVVRAIGRNVIR